MPLLYEDGGYYVKLCGDAAISLSQRAPRELPGDLVQVHRDTEEENKQGWTYHAGK